MRSISKEFRINLKIRASEVMLIDDAGGKLGIYPFREAIKLARDKDLDLVEVSPNTAPPVCKLLDYGKFRYELNKKEKETKQKKKCMELKEIKFRLKINEHDFQTKAKLIRKFLQAGDKVKVTIMFRGREMTYTARGLKMLERLAEEMAELIIIERVPRVEGRNMLMILAPK